MWKINRDVQSDFSHFASFYSLSLSLSSMHNDHIAEWENDQAKKKIELAVQRQLNSLTIKQ